MADTITYDNTTTTTTAYDNSGVADDGIQHGIDDDPTGDAEKGATIGGIGGAVVGALAGAAAGPLGAIAGAIIGGVAGGVGSGAAVAAVDQIDNDNTVSGLSNSEAPGGVNYVPTGTIGDGLRADVHELGTGIRNEYDTVRNDLRGDTDTLRGHVDNTRAAADSGVGTGYSQETEVGETMPSLKTGGVANDGTPDTRGVGEKLVDGLTGDDVDDKTGKVVNHP